LSPLPLGFMLGLALGVAFGVQGQTGEDAQRSLRLYAVLIDVGLVIGIGVLVVILANLWGQDPNRAAEAQLVDDYARPLPPRSTSNNPYEPPATN
ncbi:MAG TPA: hypothetical protein VL096_11250, partial [Pirellulaceae bacterium]|nr:hypothetical protein [Pirellulaceae bacterium]